MFLWFFCTLGRFPEGYFHTGAISFAVLGFSMGYLVVLHTPFRHPRSEHFLYTSLSRYYYSTRDHN